MHLQKNTTYNKNDSNLITDVLNALPYIAIVLNKERTIIFINSVAVNADLNITTEQLMGKRVGDALNCIHFINNITKPM